MSKKLPAKDRSRELIEHAVAVAQRDGFALMKRDAIATAAGVSFGLVTIRLGTMDQIRRTVMRHAIKHKMLPLVAQGLAARDNTAMKAPDDLKQAAAAWMAN